MFVEINPAIVCLRRTQNLFRQFEVFRTHANVDVAVGPERPVGIHAGGGPTLSQNRFNLRLPQQRKDFFDFLFVNPRLQGLKPIRLVKDFAGGGVSKRRLAYTTPTERRRAGVVKQRSYFIQLSL